MGATVQHTAATSIQRAFRGLRGRRKALQEVIEEQRHEGSRTAPVTMVTKLMLWEATAFMLVFSYFLHDMYSYVGPQPLWDSSDRYYRHGGPLVGAIAYAWFCCCDGLLLHWQVRTAFYAMIASGSMLAYLPFLVVKIPLVGKRLFRPMVVTAYDRAGVLHKKMSGKVSTATITITHPNPSLARTLSLSLGLSLGLTATTAPCPSPGCLRQVEARARG